MNAVRFAPLVVLCFAAALSHLACASSDDDVPEVIVDAETHLRDPDLYFKVEGDFVAPDEQYVVGESFRRFLSGEVWSEDRQAIVIGDRAWLKSSGNWTKKSVTDPEVRELIESNPGVTQFWTEFLDPSRLEDLNGSDEQVNGVSARKISTEDVNLFTRLLGREAKELEGVQLEEFIIWAAEDRGWPVAMRLVALSEEYPFRTSSGEDDSDGVTFDLPPEVLSSYHYTMIIASERTSDGGIATGYRTEMVFAISQVNDSDIVIQPPE